VAPFVSEDLWTEQDMTPDAIEAALRELLRERHAANQGLAPARVLNLVVIVDRDWKGEIANRLQGVGRYHASRTVLCAVEDGRDTLDARVVMSYEEPSDPAAFGLIREEVEIDMGPAHLEHLETVIDPVIVPELTTMVWSPHGHDEAIAPLLDMVDVILLDSDDILDAPDAFAHAAKLLRSVYVVDLAWLRTTPWRERLAASFDPIVRKPRLEQISQVAIRHREGSVASASLLAGWLASRLGWYDGDVAVELQTVEQEAHGLAGVTVGTADGFSLSLDRGRGGLRAREVVPGADQRSWQVLGASRGEAGILGEGVRQALLRDPTYGPALAAAQRFRP
jgi:glucose-6-phosphate dehydrogenase assembly protein OpcA